MSLIILIIIILLLAGAFGGGSRTCRLVSSRRASASPKSPRLFALRGRGGRAFGLPSLRCFPEGLTLPERDSETWRPP